MKRTATALLGSSALLLAGLAATATPASAAPSCLARVTSVTAVDLQEDVQGQDEVLLRIGNTSTPLHTYTAGQKRNTLGDPGEIFTGSAWTRLVEQDPGSATVLGPVALPCRTHTRAVAFVDSAGDVEYRVVLDVRVL